jgi:hypothetical protein
MMKIFFTTFLALVLVLTIGCQKVPTTNEELPKDHSSITLYFIPSPFGINWESPRKLFVSMIFNYFSFRPHFMGHVAIQTSCTDLNNEQHDFITGMSSKTLTGADGIFINHAGLGVLFTKNPGRFDDPRVSEQELIHRLKNPGAMSGVNFIKFKISKGACSRIAKYYSEYKEHNINRYYGLYSRPLYGEGAGCSAFGASFLEVSGLMNDELKEAWSYTINLPHRLIGRPYIEQNVFFWNILTAGSWGTEQEEHLPLFFWEPDKMYNWVNQTLSKINNQMNFKEEKLFNTKGLIQDATMLGVPSEPIWKKTDREFFKELLELNKQLYKQSL